MKSQIIENLSNPKALEVLYRENESDFKKSFNAIYPDYQDDIVAQTWNQRLNFEAKSNLIIASNDSLFIVALCIVAGFIAKIPKLFSIVEDEFYSRNIGFIVFPALIAFFSYRLKATKKQNIIMLSVLLLSLLYINVIPGTSKNDTLILAGIHLPLFLWSVLGYVFVGGQLNQTERKIDFLKFNGNLAVILAVLLIACGLLTAITFGLFQIIGININYFFNNYLIVWGLPALPIIGSYLVQTNPQLVNKISPIVAKIFMPIVLVMLLTYLIAMSGSVKSIYTNREFLLTFNMLLIGVLTIVFFSLAENSANSTYKWEKHLLLCLTITTIIVNGIALSAIIFRISAWGFTPNRSAVLGSNVLILFNLVLVSYHLAKAILQQKGTEKAEQSITWFLTIYAIWTCIVTFLFPLIFNFS
jgi:hypothetical protein